MSKRALGRNLDALLNGKKGSKRATAGVTQETANGERVGPGLKRLLNGFGGEARVPNPIDGAKKHGAFRKGFVSIPAWYFFGADLALLLMACVLISPATVPQPGNILLAGIAVVTGALVSLVPFVQSSKSWQRGHEIRESEGGSGIQGVPFDGGNEGSGAGRAPKVALTH